MERHNDHTIVYLVYCTRYRVVETRGVRNAPRRNMAMLARYGYARKLYTLYPQVVTQSSCTLEYTQ